MRNSLTSFSRTADESGSDEDFMVEDDDDSDYGQSKKKGKKVIRRGRTDKKEKKSPKPRLKATGILNLIQLFCSSQTHCIYTCCLSYVRETVLITTLRFLNLVKIHFLCRSWFTK